MSRILLCEGLFQVFYSLFEAGYVKLAVFDLGLGLNDALICLNTLVL